MFSATLLLAVVTLQNQPAPKAPIAPPSTIRVFLDCAQSGCHQDYLRDEIDFVDYVRDRTDADLHVLITSAHTGAGGREYTVSFIGLGRFAAKDHILTAVSSSTDAEERVRQGLVTAFRIGLLNYLAAGGVPEGLQVDVELNRAVQPAASAADRWNRWIFSLSGNGEIEAEESTRSRRFGLSASADRITPAWKITIGTQFDQNRQEFDLDEDDPFSTTRHNREINWLVAKSLGEHWSIGGLGELRSSTFDNIALRFEGGPAIEWNFFPYSMYTRRQLRVTYVAGVSRARYREETLFFKLSETRPVQLLSTTYEQREQWGTVQGEFEWLNYFPGFDTNRASVDGELTLRIVRGLSLSFEGSASRIRDQLSLPRRDATPEEVLLRIRRLRSGFETSAQIGVRYQFGSRFSSIVNPRFGR